MPLFAPDLAARDNDPLRRILCEHVPETFAWLLSLGVRFYGPMPEPPHRVPRMHNVLPNSRSYIYHLERHARRIGVEIRCGTRAAPADPDGGRVIGVERDDASASSPGAASCSRPATSPATPSSSALHLRAGRQGRRRQPHRDRRWPDHGARARRAHRQRRSGARPRDPLRPAAARDAWCGGCRPGLCSAASWPGRSTTCRRRSCARS